MPKDGSEYLIERYDNVYEVVIGLEVHAQVTSNSKLFSSSSTKFGAEPNTQVSLVDAAFPGMLPVINEYCVKQAIKTGIGLRAQINKRSVFDRKNYFYADLPQGYQISQFKYPIVGEGTVVLDMPNGQKEVGIERLHLEQDAGKSIHDMDPQNTLVDLNRSGVALMEIVSKPDLRTPDEVSAYIKKLRSIMRYLGTCDGNMQEGSLRADVNVSVRLKDSKELGTRCEIKNVNSIKFMQMAINYEANRQVDLIEEGKSIDQETRLFDTSTGETRSMRSKEDAHDYRYFPDPDLLPLEVTDEFIDQLKADIPSFRPGDTVVVSVKVQEGDRTRLQAFEGVVMNIKKAGLNSAFIVRKISSGIGVERTFQMHSPLIDSISVKRKGDVRQATLYYLRERSGRSARIKERLD